MGTIRCGFWTKRFLITPEEFAVWVDLCEEEKFIFTVPNYHQDKHEAQQVKKIYQEYYYQVLSEKNEAARFSGCNYSISKQDFLNGFFLRTLPGAFYPEKTLVQREFALELTSPKAYSVNDEDGIHFHYEDIHQIEPQAKAMFDQLTCEIKKITKPLYYQDKVFYSIRISRSAYADLRKSALFHGSGQGLTSKWQQ